MLELPTDRPRPPLQTFNGAKESLVLSQELSEEIKALSRREGATLFMTLLAAFNTLLCRHSGQEDIIVGSPIAGRNRAEIEALNWFLCQYFSAAYRFIWQSQFPGSCCNECVRWL